MEAFSLLKYWRVGGGGSGCSVGGFAAGDSNSDARNGNTVANARGVASTTTIVTAVTHESDDEDDDDGPFFDLEFSVPDEDVEEKFKDSCNNSVGVEEDDEEVEEEEEDIESFETDGEREEFNFTLSSGSSESRTDPNPSLSPSDDLFFKGRLVPVEPSFNASEPNSKLQFPSSLLKSATKFRVFTLGLKKPKSTAVEKTESNVSTEAKQKPQRETQQQQQSKLFTVKFKVEEVPIVSLFTRDNSSKISSGNNKPQKQTSDDSVSDEKRFTKDVMQKYLKMVKPLYVRVSRRYGEKLRFSGQISLGSSAKTELEAKTSPLTKSAVAKTESEAEITETTASGLRSLKPGNIPAGLRVVCKHLGKSRSASAAVAAAPPFPIQPKRRDDSLLQQQDGIQSAILHCKRSFNASRDTQQLSRSASDTYHEKGIDFSRKSAAKATLF